MTDLSSLENKSRAYKRRKRVGRGPGSGMGKTSGRGHKGAGSRSGYKRRLTYEGGGLRLFQKLPIRGFSRARFRKEMHVINLDQIERAFSDGEMVNIETLRKHGFISGPCHGVKVLGKGDLTKKLTGFEVDALSKGAREKIEKTGISIA